MNQGLKTIQLSTGELVIADTKFRELTIIDRVPGKSVAWMAEFSCQESLVQLRDLLLELFPLDYKAYDEAEIATPMAAG